MKLFASRDNQDSPLESTHAPGVLVYGGRNYAVGLLWLTVQEDTDKKLLRQRIAKTKADFYCLRSHVSQQHGFGWLSKGHRRGMPAAAAMIADQLVGEWHGVFEAENGWWYVQVRSDTITPTGDRFFASEEVAYQTFQDEATKNIWPHSYAPEKWRMAETRELKLGTVLDNLMTTALVPTNITASFGTAATRNLVLGGLVGVLAIMGLIVAMTLGNTTVEMPIPTTPIRPVVSSAPKLAAPEQLSESVSPQQLLQQCGEALGKLYQSLPGWKPGVFNCELGSANINWQQSGGTLSDAKATGMRHWPKEVSIVFNNNLMTAALKTGNLPKMESANLVNQETALLYLEQNIQPLGGLQIKPVVPAPPPPPPPSGTFDTSAPPPPAPPAPPPYLEITFTSGFGPDKIGPFLDVPGMEIKKMQWNISQSLWTYNLKWTYQKPGAVPPSRAAAPATGAANTGAIPGNVQAAVPVAVPGNVTEMAPSATGPALNTGAVTQTVPSSPTPAVMTQNTLEPISPVTPSAASSNPPVAPQFTPQFTPQLTPQAAPSAPAPGSATPSQPAMPPTIPPAPPGQPVTQPMTPSPQGGQP